MRLKLWAVVIAVGLAAMPASAEVVRIEVQSRADLVGGQPFGAAGPYEKLSGKIYFAVDPALPVVPDVAEVPDVPEVEDELEPSRGCAAADDGRERCELRPCAFFERLALLVTDDEVELVSSLVFPAIAASSLPAELFEVKSGVASLRR